MTCRSRSSLALRPFIMCCVRGMTDFPEEKVSLLTSSSNFSLHEKHKHYNFSRENTANRNSSKHLKQFFIKIQGGWGGYTCTMKTHHLLKISRIFLLIKKKNDWDLQLTFKLTHTHVHVNHIQDIQV